MIFVLLSSFLLLDGTFGQTPTQACTDAQRAINANQACSQVVQRISQEALNGQIPLSSDFEEYCTPACRSLNAQLISSCSQNNPSDDMTTSTEALLGATCTVSGNQSCFQYFATFNPPDECGPLTASNCPSACETGIQAYVNTAGCCARVLLGFARDSNALPVTVNQLYSTCNINEPMDQPPCQAIGGSNGDGGLKAFGISGLLFFVAIATVF